MKKSGRQRALVIQAGLHYKDKVSYSKFWSFPSRSFPRRLYSGLVRSGLGIAHVV